VADVSVLRRGPVEKWKIVSVAPITRVAHSTLRGQSSGRQFGATDVHTRRRVRGCRKSGVVCPLVFLAPWSKNQEDRVAQSLAFAMTASASGAFA
jgi:hypothetical protein